MTVRRVPRRTPGLLDLLEGECEPRREKPELEDSEAPQQTSAFCMFVDKDKLKLLLRMCLKFES